MPMTNENEPLVVQDPRKILKKCSNCILKKLETRSEVFFDDTPIRSGQVDIYNLHSKEFIMVIYKDRKIPLIPLLETELSESPDSYWLALSIIFSPYVGRFKLNGISIKVFKGIRSDTNKDLFFRAEWHSPKNDNDTDHAQPHWHVHRAFEGIKEVYDSIDPIDSSKPEDFGESIQSKEADLKSLPSFDKIHFAMASTWHINEGHKINFKEETLINWLGGCVNYIKNEIAYMTKKRQDYLNNL
ncbi:MAG: hypothetical protein M1269_02490 [Chloroflexi bacterium]|nr:hypothetical protein [Chloroflexota bacterium]